MWILFLPFLNSWLKVEVNDLDMQFLDNVNKLKELIDSQTIHWTTFLLNFISNCFDKLITTFAII